MYRAHDDQIDAVFLLHQQLRTLMDRRMRPFGLTYAKYQLLACIKDHGPCTSGQVAIKLGLLPGSLTKPIKSLVDAGWVKEDQEVFDQRKWWLTASQQGSDLWHKAQAVRDDVFIEVLDSIDPSHGHPLHEALSAMSRTATRLLSSNSEKSG